MAAAERLELDPDSPHRDSPQAYDERWRRGRAQKMIAHISAVKDDVQVLHVEARDLLDTAVSPLSDDALMIGTNSLLRFADRSLELEGRLSSLAKKEISAKALHADVVADLVACTGVIEKARRKWDDETQRRVRARAGTAATYQSGSLTIRFSSLLGADDFLQNITTKLASRTPMSSSS